MVSRRDALSTVTVLPAPLAPKPAAVMPPAVPISTPRPLSSAPATPPRTVTSPLASRPDSRRTCSPAVTRMDAPPSPLASSAKVTPVAPASPPAMTAPRTSTSLAPLMVTVLFAAVVRTELTAWT